MYRWKRVSIDCQVYVQAVATITVLVSVRQFSSCACKKGVLLGLIELCAYLKCLCVYMYIPAVKPVHFSHHKFLSVVVDMKECTLLLAAFHPFVLQTEFIDQFTFITALLMIVVIFLIWADLNQELSLITYMYFGFQVESFFFC